MFSTAGDNYLLTFAVLLCAVLGPNLCPVISQYSVIAGTKRERNLQLGLPWQNGERSYGTHLEQ